MLQKFCKPARGLQEFYTQRQMKMDGPGIMHPVIARAVPVQQVGVRPELFARIASFEAALDGNARFAAKSSMDVAHQFRFYDQMHMIHSFGKVAVDESLFRVLAF